DEDVRALDALRLCADRDAAIRGRDLQPLRGCERLELIGHLSGELARRHEHERRGARVGGDGALDDRQGEGERLAGSGGRLGEHVEPGERVRKNERLNRKRVVDGTGREHADDVRGHAELAERLVLHVVRLLYGFETCLPRNTRRRNEKLISPGGGIADPWAHSSSRTPRESLHRGRPAPRASAILRGPKEYSCG